MTETRRGAARAAAKETFRALPRAARGSFNEFWRERNDPDRDTRFKHQFTQGQRYKRSQAAKAKELTP